MKKSKIYTKTGDEGVTGLVSGNRTLKSDERISAYGELDELNSRLGLVCAYLKNSHPQEVDFLYTIQSSIFDLGSNMACEFENRAKYKLPKLKLSTVEEMEMAMDRMEASLEPLKNFILPGGTLASSHIHLARTCARAVERMLVHYQQASKEELPELSIVFLNRLSDYLFVLARFICKSEKGAEIYWIPKV